MRVRSSQPQQPHLHPGLQPAPSALGAGPREQGFTLGTMLMVISLAVVFAFALASLSIVHLQLTGREYARHMAENMADSAINEAVANILANPYFGTKPTDSCILRFSYAPPKSGGYLFFKPGQSTDSGLPVPPSFNNFSSAAAITPPMLPTTPFTLTQIPANAIQLVAVGVYGDVTRCRQMVLQSPAFPDCLAAAGTVTSTGSLTVTGLSDPNPDIHDPNLLAPGNLAPGDLVSNSPNQGYAVNLSGVVNVTGDIKTCGRISIPPVPPTNVGGGTYQGIDPIVLPFVDIAGKIALVDDLNSPSATTYNGETSLNSGFYSAPGSASVSGDLQLDNAVLVVHGDLTISGGVTGVGCILTQGNLEVDKASNLAPGDNRVALLSQGDMTLNGSGSGSSYFSGLVYTAGNFSADSITLMGAFVANPNVPAPQSTPNPPMDVPPGLSPPPPVTGGNVSLNDVTMVHIPGETTVQVTMFTDGSGVPTLQFKKSTVSGFLGISWLGSSAAGYFIPNSRSIPVEISVSFAPPGIYTYSGTGFGPTTDVEAAIQDIKNYVKSQQPNKSWPESGKIFDSGAFDRGIPAMIRRMQGIAINQYKVQTGSSVANTNMFGVDPNEFLAPNDQLRVTLWEPVQYP